MLAENNKQIPPSLPMTTSAAVRQLMKSGRGVLLICHERERAAVLALECLADTACGYVRDERGFNTVLCAPDLEKLQDVWHDIILVDGDVLPGEAAMIREKCPRARVSQLRKNPALTNLLRTLAMDDETLRGLYRRLRSPGNWAAGALAEDTGLSVPQVLTGLTAFSQVKLVKFSPEPYALHLLPPVKCHMDDSALVRYIRGMFQE